MLNKLKRIEKPMLICLHLQVFDVENALQFMMSITGLPSDYCEALDECDFFEAYGVSSEDAEKQGYI